VKNTTNDAQVESALNDFMNHDDPHKKLCVVTAMVIVGTPPAIIARSLRPVRADSGKTLSVCGSMGRGVLAVIVLMAGRVMTTTCFWCPGCLGFHKEESIQSSDMNNKCIRIRLVMGRSPVAWANGCGLVSPSHGLDGRQRPASHRQFGCHVCVGLLPIH